MTQRWFPQFLSSTDGSAEVAFAVIMVVIINGYVALGNLNSGFLYIIRVDVLACAAWGIIDGFIYATSSAIDRGRDAKLVQQLRQPENRPAAASEVRGLLDDTFLSYFSPDAKAKISETILANPPEADVIPSRTITWEEGRGWIAILGIYMAVAALLALPFLLVPDKLAAWYVSNALGIGWLFWYGARIGQAVQGNRIVWAVVPAAVGIALLAVSYVVYG
ncbi:MAG: hypothetical protein ABSA15_00580 [Thermoplasmata archaeon]|jgi:VIT1/CCC1 family predicted Fe2+/Mn2+ transporter